MNMFLFLFLITKKMFNIKKILTLGRFYSINDTAQNIF